MAATRWTNPTVNKAAELWAQGLSCPEIAEHFAEANKFFTAEDFRKLAHRNREKFPLRGPAHHAEAVRRGLARRVAENVKGGITRPKRRSPHLAEICRRWKQGWTAPEIAQKTGLRLLQVTGIIARNREHFPRKYRNPDGPPARRPGKFVHRRPAFVSHTTQQGEG